MNWKKLFGFGRRIRFDDKIHCPECGTTKLRLLGLDEAPLQRYSIPFECENGHRFNRVREDQ